MGYISHRFLVFPHFQLSLDQLVCSVKPSRYKFTTALLPVCYCCESAGGRGTRTAVRTSLSRSKYCAILLFWEYPIRDIGLFSSCESLHVI